MELYSNDLMTYQYIDVVVLSSNLIFSMQYFTYRISYNP